AACVLVRVLSQTEGQFKPCWRPLHGVRCQHDLTDPPAQIPSYFFDFALPDAGNRGVQLLAVEAGDMIEHLVCNPQHPRLIFRCDRKQTERLQSRQQLKLDGVKKMSSRQRVQTFEGSNLLARLKSVNGVEHEPIGTHCELLQGRRRIWT